MLKPKECPVFLLTLSEVGRIQKSVSLETRNYIISELSKLTAKKRCLDDR
jgi:hypothetical protein